MAWTNSATAGVILNRRAQLAAVCGLACTGAASAQFSVGANVNISRRPGNQAEAAITINPTNPLNLFALYNNLSSGGGQFGAVSMDGGAIWAPRAVGTGSDGLSASIGDPTVSFDSFGNLFLAHLTSGAVNTQVGLSTNGGVSFATLMTVAASCDQPTVIAGAGAVWVAWTQSSAVMVRGAGVTGLGTVGAFSGSMTVPSSNSGIAGDFGDIAIGPGGRVATVYQNANSGTGPDSIFFNLKPDGLGAGPWGARSVATSTAVGGFDYIPAQNTRSIDAESGLAYDRTGGPHNGRLYLMYTDAAAVGSSDTNIMIRYSDNDGLTWSAAHRINDDATVRSQFLPKIALDPVTGHIAVTWYDARNDPSNVLCEIWGSASLDGGVTWLPNIKISQGRSTAAPDNGFDFGDFTGLTIYNDVFYPVWADDSNSTGDNPNGTGAMDIYTARVSICYANCDNSTVPPVLNVLDFSCFLNKFAAGDPYANCDGSTTPPVLNVLDFACFLNKFAAGCP